MVKISAVVPTYNSERTIERCLHSLESNRVDEIIVVDGGSEDRTLDLASRFHGTRIVPTGIRPLGRARLVGWQATNADFILFIDGDAYYQQSDAVERLSQYFSEPQIAGVTSRVACGNPTNLLARLRDIDFQLTYDGKFRNSDTIDCVSDPFMGGLFRRKPLEEVSGSDAHYLPYAEDLQLLNKLVAKRYRVLTVADPPVHHNHRTTLRDAYIQFYNHGFGRGMLMKELHTHFYLSRQPTNFLHRLLDTPLRGKDLLVYPFYRIMTEIAFFWGYSTAINT